MTRVVWVAAMFVAMCALTVALAAQLSGPSITVYKNAD